MKPETLIKIVNSIRANKSLCLFITVMDKLTVIMTVLLYIYLLAMAALTDLPTFLRTLLTPAVCFVAFSIVRKLIDAPRPYEVYGFTSVTGKNKKGSSFPSRHVFSIFLVGITAYTFDHRIAMGTFVLGIVLMVLRVIEGVHFIRDVVVGMISAFVLQVIVDWIVFLIIGALL